jgi:protein-disulfide isomerase
MTDDEEAGSPVADPPPQPPVPDPPAAVVVEPMPVVPPGRGSLGGLVGGLALAVVLVGLSFGAGFLVGRGTAPGTEADASAGPSSPAPDASAGPTSPPTSPIADLPSDGPRLGRADARVTVDYWADYQCPFCSLFAEQIIPALVDRIADGSISLVHRDFAFLGPESFDAAVAARCADREDRYWAMHDAIYAGQQGENQGAFARDRLVAIATSIGLDEEAFRACLDDENVLVEVLDDTSAGTRAAVSSTPTIDVAGRRFTGVPKVDELLAAIDAAIAGASPVPAPTMEPLGDPWALIETDGRTAGPADAPVTVELWSDYQSSDGAAFVDTIEPELRARAGAGSIRLVRRDLAVLGDESVIAAATVRCAERQGSLGWLVHSALTVSGRGAGSGVFTTQNLLRFAARLGLDVSAFYACLTDPAVEVAITAETAAGQAAGLTSGPALVIRVGDREVDRFSGTFDLAAVTAALDAAAGG